MNRALMVMKDLLWIYIVGTSIFLATWQLMSGISVVEHIRRNFGSQSLVFFTTAFLCPLFLYTFLQIRWVRVLLTQSL